jgi:diguanylate cyclase (GGDEF)-like protein/PAS domain S-box-containing protein
MHISAPFAPSLASQDAAELHDQLFRYAQDLQELMWQYAELQSRHQKMLMAMRHGEHGADLLFNAMLQATALYLTTDPQGKITFASPGLDCAPLKQSRSLTGQSVRQLAPPGGQGEMDVLLSHLSKNAASNSIWHGRLALPVDKPDKRLVEALIMHVNSDGLPQIYWFLADAVDRNFGALDIKKWFTFFDASPDGLVITNAAGKIEAINSTCSSITEFGEPEVLGCDPGVFAAGLHDAAFFNSFWQSLHISGCWTGELFNRRKSGQVFLLSMTVKAIRSTDAEVVGYIAAFDDKSVRAQEPRKPERLALHDARTGLPDRRLLNMHMTRAMIDASNQRRKLFVLWLELDQFNALNDELGEATGDLVLQQVSARLQSAVRRTDTIARIGEYRFVALLSSVDNQADSEKIANAMLFALSAPVHVGFHSLDLNLRIGGACYPSDGDDIAGLMNHAQAAMQEARRVDQSIGFLKPGLAP